MKKITNRHILRNKYKKKLDKKNKVKLPYKFNKGLIYYNNPEFSLKLIIPNNIIQQIFKFIYN